MKKIISIVSLYAFPLLTFAAVESFENLVGVINEILNKILPIIIAIAVIYFVYNALMYMIAADEERKGEAKSKMIYGIVALFVMVSVWGLVEILSGTFGFTGGETPGDLPGLPGVTSVSV